MVAYSFKRQFVGPIAAGLGIDPPPGFDPAPQLPKRQTIRGEGKRRHARPGDVLQLYHGMRTKQCVKIGEARCASVHLLRIDVEPTCIVVRFEGVMLRPESLADFARRDGFASEHEMWKFWRDNHGICHGWLGVLIKWEPLR